MCPGIVGGGEDSSVDTLSPYMLHYQATYNKMTELEGLGSDFPRIGPLDIEDNGLVLPFGTICNRSLDSVETDEGLTVVTVSWPEWSPQTVDDNDAVANCHRRDDSTHEAPYVLYQDGDVDAMCYACACSIDDMNLTTSSYCEEFEADVKSASRWGMVATIIVVIVNQVLKQTIVQTSPWLKSHTVEEELRSKVVRIFLCQVTNTAILVLLTKSTLGPFAKIPGEHYSSFNAKWYASVAAPMMVTMMIQFAMPVFMHIFMALLGWLIRCVKSGSAVTQNQLNQLYIPKQRDFAAGYGEILLAMSVTMIYGPAVPAMYFVAAGTPQPLSHATPTPHSHSIHDCMMHNCAVLWCCVLYVVCSWLWASLLRRALLRPAHLPQASSLLKGTRGQLQQVRTDPTKQNKNRPGFEIETLRFPRQA